MPRKKLDTLFLSQVEVTLSFPDYRSESLLNSVCDFTRKRRLTKWQEESQQERREMDFRFRLIVTARVSGVENRVNLFNA